MKPFTMLATLLLALIALVHLYRLVAGLDVIVAGHVVPGWVSVVGLIVAGGLAFGLWREGRGR